MPKIVFSDDDLEIQELLKFAFEAENYEVILCSDGDEALKKIKKRETGYCCLRCINA